MEAIWNLEDKWKISTLGAVTALLVICTCSFVIGICIIIAFKRKTRKSLEDQEPCIDDDQVQAESVKEVLTSSVQWSQKGKPSPLLVSGDQLQCSSQSSDSAVWKRPILMGEKCKLLKFSGLILYDQKGEATSSRR